LIMLSGVYYGAQYGGSTTAILINLPGEPSSVVTALDGYQMARQGRAGPALAIAALGSLFAGCVGTLLLAAFSPPLTELGFKFGPTEYFSLMVLGLIGAVVLSSGSLPKALAMIVLGLLLGQVGTDVMSGERRYSFGFSELGDGIGFVAIVMGMFGFAEIVVNLSRPAEERQVFTSKVNGLWPSPKDFREAIPAVLRGTAIGSVLGALPGGGAILSSFTAYSVEKKISKHPERFGKGAIQGVAAPEAANNASAQVSFIPMLTLGLPSSGVMALMIGALMIKGIQPGPQVMSSNPELFWGLIASMWLGNVMLVILNLPLIGIWIRLLRVPYLAMFPAIMAFSCIGLYTLNNITFDIYIAVACGVLGYLFNKLKCEPAPLLLGYTLGPLMEENLRRSLLMSQGDWMTFFESGLSSGMLAVSGLMLILAALPRMRSRRKRTFQEAG
jgi:putative tricarboxylic transport membrane protein